MLCDECYDNSLTSIANYSITRHSVALTLLLFYELSSHR
jgi:hypothetical protein